MSYLNYDGLAYFKSKLTNWIDQNYLSKTNIGSTTIAGNVIFRKSITVDSGDPQNPAYIFGNLDGKAKKDWLDQKIDETYIKSIATNDNAGTIVYTKGNGSTNHILIDLLHGATPTANGRAGLVPAPTVSEMNYFLRGDGNWAVPTDVYVNQNLIASSNNNQFPVLLSGTSGTPATKTNATVGYTNVVSVNPLTNALMASQFISKHPTYNRQSAVTSKVQYSLNFTDIVSGAGHNLGEVVGYVDTLANGGEHELGLRLFGNPNVQGTEEDYVYMGVGLSKTNVAYGHAPSTPLPSAHNEPTDIITRDWLARNGSETGLVHTSMNETIGGIKTFTDETRNTSSAGITTTKLTASGKITGTSTAEISGGSGNTPSLKVTGNETVTGDLNVGGSETVAGNETVTGNISTANGTVSAKTGSIGTGGLTVTGPSNLNGKVTAGNGLDVTGNETVSGNLTVGGTTDTDDLSVTDDATIGDTVTVGGQILKQTGTSTTQEYVSYVTNQQETKTTIINNLIDPDQGLKLITKGSGANAKDYIAFKIGNGLAFHDTNDSAGIKGQVDVDFNGIPASVRADIVNSMVDPEGAIIPNTEVPQSNTARYGKLTVDFSKLSDAQIERIVMSMIAQDNQGHLTGGLATDTHGKLIVDFNQMPQDRFNALKDSLDMQRTLFSNKVVHVDYDNADDDIYQNSTTKIIDDTKGTIDNPFKTIQGAVNFITRVYALGPYNAYIYVHPRANNEPYTSNVITLPNFTRTTGRINILAAALKDIGDSAYLSDSDRPIIANANPLQSVISVTGGYWTFQGLKVKNVVSDNGSGVPEYSNGIIVTNGSELRLYYTGIYMEYTGSTIPTHSIYMRALAANGNVYVHPSKHGPSSIEVHKGNCTSANAVTLETGGSFWLASSNIADTNSAYKFLLSGEISAIFNVSGGHVGWAGGDLRRSTFEIPAANSEIFDFAVSSDPTQHEKGDLIPTSANDELVTYARNALNGRMPYIIRSGGSMYMRGRPRDTNNNEVPSIPGTYLDNPAVESESYSWYAVSSAIPVTNPE